MKKLVLLYLIFTTSSVCFGQSLFENNDVLDMEIEFPLLSMLENRRKYFHENEGKESLPATIKIYQSGTLLTQVPAQVFSRGKMRLLVCGIPPLKVKIKKKDAQGSMFAGNEELKLVLPCGADLVKNKANKSLNTLILREYSAYRIYEKNTPFHFKTRLFNLKIIDPNLNRDGMLSGLLAFFIESHDSIGTRTNSKKLSDEAALQSFYKANKKKDPLKFDSETEKQLKIFKACIGDVDHHYSVKNYKYFVNPNEPNLVYRAPYDFDLSFFVRNSFSVNGTLNFGRLFRNARQNRARQDKKCSAIENYPEAMREYESILGTLN